MKIGEFAAQMGVAPSTLRYYEEIGLLPPVPRVNSQRVYPTDYVALVRFITLSSQVGYTLDEIKPLLRQLFNEHTLDRAVWQATIQTKLTEIEAMIERYRIMHESLTCMLDCDWQTAKSILLDVAECKEPASDHDS